MVSVSVRSLFHQPMDEKKKTWTLCFPAKETLMWRRHCSIDQSCCSMTSKQFLESSSGMKFVYPSVRLTNQKPGAFVSVRYTNQIALFPFVCCFCFVRAFSFQGHTKIALLLFCLQNYLSALLGTGLLNGGMQVRDLAGMAQGIFPSHSQTP